MLQTEPGFENNCQQRETKYITGGKKRLHFRIGTALKKGGTWVMKKWAVFSKTLKHNKKLFFS